LIKRDRQSFGIVISQQAFPLIELIFSPGILSAAQANQTFDKSQGTGSEPVKDLGLLCENPDKAYSCAAVLLACTGLGFILPRLMTLNI
jgi:hypothetical protein